MYAVDKLRVDTSSLLAFLNEIQRLRVSTIDAILINELKNQNQALYDKYSVKSTIVSIFDQRIIETFIEVYAQLDEVVEYMNECIATSEIKEQKDLSTEDEENLANIQKLIKQI